MWFEVRDRLELRSGSVVGLKVVDLLVVDIKVDMDEVDSHRVVSNLDLSRVVIPDTTLYLGLEVKAFREARYRCSSLGCRVRFDLIGLDYEREISDILLMVEPGVVVTVGHHYVHVHGNIASSRE